MIPYLGQPLEAVVAVACSASCRACVELVIHTLQITTGVVQKRRSCHCHSSQVLMFVLEAHDQALVGVTIANSLA